MSGINAELETKIVALVARGDTYDEIIKEAGYVSRITFTRIRKRNKENIKLIKLQMQFKVAGDVAAINEQANTKISERLQRDTLLSKVLSKAHKDYIDGKINFNDYKYVLQSNKELSMTDLINVSKEMHSQKGDEGDGSGSGSRNPEDIAALVAAIKSGDQVKITQVAFGDSSNNASSV